MSFDLSLSTVCDHRVYRERCVLDADRKSIRVSKPIASTGTLSLWASENQVPKADYLIVFDPLSVSTDMAKMIQFRYKWRSTLDYFEVTYGTLKGFCPKCVGLGEVDDLSWDVRGQLTQTRNEKLLLQNLEKFVVTYLGSNPFHPFVGTSLINLIGQRVVDFDYLTSQITQEVHTTLGKLKDLQQQYVRAGRAMTAGEQLESIRSVKVTRAEDPTIVMVEVTVTAQSGQPLNYTQYLKLATR
jgi:hypothetical protein